MTQQNTHRSLNCPAQALLGCHVAIDQDNESPALAFPHFFQFLDRDRGGGSSQGREGGHPIPVGTIQEQTELISARPFPAVEIPARSSMVDGERMDRRREEVALRKLQLALDSLSRSQAYSESVVCGQSMENGTFDGPCPFPTISLDHPWHHGARGVGSDAVNQVIHWMMGIR